ncbi:hypothetical protein Q5P01_008333 [Channa striata]|uniref:Lysosome-associated membrane glycoprotein 2-like luminal domain-containing protein n=1 Tax=Channa striata TaxID=64152 RepID=A0AA88SZE8_CHASR|nr:hypothetical protein Q5P01_008333 [Channa striata]
MKSASAAAFVALFVLFSARSLAEDAKNRSKPPATVAPAQAFSSTIGPTTTAVTSNTTTPHANTTTPHPNTTTPHPNTTTPHPNTTTPHPNTTTPHPNTTTPHANTTTPHANTTTPHPNTTTPHPNTTTPHPKTTTPKTTPAPTPTPPTNLKVGNYSVKTKDNKVCLKAWVALQIRLVSPKANGTFIVQPDETKADGGCQETTANLTLFFKQGFITFIFNKSVSENTVYVNALSFKVFYPLGGNGDSYNADNRSVRLFPAKIGHSYSCRNESVFMGNGLYLDVSQDKMQAFNLTSGDFGVPDPCPADKPDYSVAIGVGVALLVLIVIVVVVYILSRKKRTDGYQSL